MSKLKRILRLSQKEIDTLQKHYELFTEPENEIVENIDFRAIADAFCRFGLQSSDGVKGESF